MAIFTLVWNEDIVKILSAGTEFAQSGETISLNVNVDGVPLHKSIAVLANFGNLNVCIIALHFGKSNPSSVDEFLTDFLTELSELKVTGKPFKDKAFTLKLNCFICDAPARSLLKSAISHTGY